MRVESGAEAGRLDLFNFVIFGSAIRNEEPEFEETTDQDIVPGSCRRRRSCQGGQEKTETERESHMRSWTSSQLHPGLMSLNAAYHAMQCQNLPFVAY